MRFTRQRGARHGSFLLKLPSMRFNSRAREGRDGFECIVCRLCYVSIHAPARGATLSWSFSSAADFCFNSRAREGRYQGDWAVCSQRFGFNSRAREGRDSAVSCNQLRPFYVSIHAPARGATMVAQGKGARRDVSIHAPAKGATDEDEYFADYEQVSIHAPARGATVWLYQSAA